jgi:hypothetical protein
MVNEVHSISQMFKDITDRVTEASKRGYSTALSSIGASQKAGKTTVLKMEISARKVKMKKLFTKLGERVFSLKTANRIDILQDAHIQELTANLKLYENEINEIENYIASLEYSNSSKNLGQNRINESTDIRIVENTLRERKNSKDFLSDNTDEKKLELNNADIETKKPDDISAIINELKDRNKDVRIKALKQLFKSDNPESAPHLINALKDREAEIRRRAASYLGWKMVISAAPSLISAAKDRNPSVRKACLEALGELTTREAVPILIEMLDDRDLETRKAAYKSLAKTTNEFIEFKADGSLSERFKSIQKWEKWWENQKA